MSAAWIRRIGLALVLVCLTGTVALAQDDYRAILGQDAGLFPGAEFKKIFHFPKATVVTFETGASPADIAAFYRKDLVARGWHVDVNDVGPKALFLMVSKKQRRLIVEAQRGLPGRTALSISL